MVSCIKLIVNRLFCFVLLQNAVEELYIHMKQFADSTEAEVLWRLARATCDKAKSTTDKTLRKDLMYDAFRAAEQALKVGESNFSCHKVTHLSKIDHQYCLLPVLLLISVLLPFLRAKAATAFSAS